MSLTGNFEPKASPRPRNTTFCLTSRLSLVSRRANPRSLWLKLPTRRVSNQVHLGEQTIIERRRCANRARYPLTETDMKMLSVIVLIGGAALLTAAPVSLHRSQNTVALSLDSADARIGRPRTAMSVAGVQRRGYRRAYRGAVYRGVAGYGAGSYYSGYSSPAYSAPYYGGYGYPRYSAPYYGSGYGSYYDGYGFSTAPLYNPVTFRLPGWRY